MIESQLSAKDLVVTASPLTSRKVIDHTRSLDPTRPVTFACNQAYNTDRVVSSLSNKLLLHA